MNLPKMKSSHVKEAHPQQGEHHQQAAPRLHTGLVLAAPLSPYPLLVSLHVGMYHHLLTPAIIGAHLLPYMRSSAHLCLTLKKAIIILHHHHTAKRLPKATRLARIG